MIRILQGLIRSRFVRFLIAGAINTLATYVLYLLVLRIAPYKIAYSISYVIGIFISFAINRFFVFQESRGVQSALTFPLVYVVQYLIGLLAMWIFVEQLGMNSKIAPLATIAITVPVTFVLARAVFTKKSTARPKKL